MSFTAKLTAAYGLLLAVAVGSSCLAYWAGRQASDQLRKSQVSHKVYSGQLELKADAYHLFKELSDALLIGDRDGGDTERRLEARLQDSLSSVRRLTAKERQLLEFFLSRQDVALSRERILGAVWSASQDPLTNVVDVYVARLRRRLGDDGSTIPETVRGAGYRFNSHALKSDREADGQDA